MEATTLIGENCDAAHGFDPQILADLKSQVCRLPVWRDNGFDYKPFITGLQALGIEPLIVLDKRSLSGGGSYQMKIERIRRLYPTVTRYQVGNEPDQPDSESSWHMSQGRFNSLLRAARGILPSPRYYLIAGGLVSGNAAWLDRVDLSLVDGYAAHPYGQAADGYPTLHWGFGSARDLLLNYKAKAPGKDLWITEFGGHLDLFDDEHQRAVYFSKLLEVFDSLNVYAALHFCLSDIMVDGFGLLDSEGNALESWAAIHDAVGG